MRWKNINYHIRAATPYALRLPSGERRIDSKKKKKPPYAYAKNYTCIPYIQLGGNEIGTPHKRGEYAARLTQI